MKLYVLTMGRQLYYVSEDYEDVEYERNVSEETNSLGRKQGFKLDELKFTKEQLESPSSFKVKLSNNVEYTVEEILNLL